VHPVVSDFSFWGKLKGKPTHFFMVDIMSIVEGNVSIKYEPFKEIVIMEKTRFPSADDMARFTSVIAGGKLAGLYWAEGIVFLYFPLPPSNTAVARMLIESGKVYWTFVGYALLPRYMPTIETKEKMIVPVIDISSNPLLRQVALWLKAQP
jgi:hypothetical protein